VSGRRRRLRRGIARKLAEEKRFELLVAFTTAVFKTAALDHSATPPEESGAMLGAVTLDPVEAALAAGIDAATIAGRGDVVTQLAVGLEARRLARASSNVVSLDANRVARKKQ
jgi:hypothetical protein